MVWRPGSGSIYVERHADAANRERLWSVDGG